MGRILSIDYGKKRTGIAVTDPLRIIASGLTTVATEDLFEFLQKYCAEEPVDAFVIGWPMGLDGLATDNTQPVADFCAKLGKLFPDKKVYQQDERFTSKEAKLAILQSGAKKKKRQDKSLVDKVAATIILQAFMEDNRELF